MINPLHAVMEAAREVGAVRRELQGCEFALLPEIVRAIAGAFLADAAARAPAPRFRIASGP